GYGGYGSFDDDDGFSTFGGGKKTYGGYGGSSYGGSSYGGNTYGGSGYGGNSAYGNSGIKRSVYKPQSYGSTYGSGSYGGGSYGGTTYGGSGYGGASKPKTTGGAFGGIGNKPAAGGGKDLSVFSVGVKVSHPKFGQGTIVNVHGIGGNMILDVAFENGLGIKQLSASLAPLTVVK
ncbi:MAG: hypothetical protein IJB97_01285, partial [Clostridia bacterium]|nr:hypothetical protein [Clostridia bacterium]